MAKLIVIPARLASQRLPRKLLLDETGWPLIRHVHERCLQVQDVDRVIVATDGEPLQTVVEEFGGEAVITAEDLPTGTDRVAAACQTLGLSGDDLVINVQGDEPELDPAQIDTLVTLMQGCADPMGTLAEPLADPDDLGRSQVVKVVLNLAGQALYFSRAAIPTGASLGVGGPLRHIGIYAYRPDFLQTFCQLEPTPLEAAERLEHPTPDVGLGSNIRRQFLSAPRTVMPTLVQR